MTQPTVFVIYYSMYGHVQTLAREVVRGLKKSGVNVKLYQIAETLPQDVLDKMHAPNKESDVPLITPDDLKQADGLIFGISTRFGLFPSQVKAFFDACGQLWMQKDLYGKFAGVFFSTSNMGGGQETTAFSCLPFFAHMGMCYVPIGYKCPVLQDNTEPRGGSPWGAGTLAFDASRKVSNKELTIAFFQGEEFGELLKRTIKTKKIALPTIEAPAASAPTAKGRAPSVPTTSTPIASAPASSEEKPKKTKTKTCLLL